MRCSYCKKEFLTALAWALHEAVHCEAMPEEKSWFKDDPILRAVK